MMYFDYIKEREGKDFIVFPFGFMIYKIHGEECHICDAYVEPDKRCSYVATEMANKLTKIAKEKGCKILSANVVPSLNGATESIQAQLKYGFKIHSAHHDCIVLTKEI